MPHHNDNTQIGPEPVWKVSNEKVDVGMIEAFYIHVTLSMTQFCNISAVHSFPLKFRCFCFSLSSMVTYLMEFLLAINSAYFE